MTDERTDLIARLRTAYKTLSLCQGLSVGYGTFGEAADLLERDGDELARLADKALRFDLDAAGIASRERDAVELVELRAKLAMAKSASKKYVYSTNGVIDRAEARIAELERELTRTEYERHMTALERDTLRAENEALRKDAETLQRVEKRIEELWDTVAPVSYDDPGSYRRGRTIGTADTLDAIRDAIYAAKERTP